MRGLDKIWILLASAELIAMLAVTNACTKDKQVDLNPELNVANDIVIAQRPLLHAFRMLARAVNDTALQQTGHDYFDGATVTYNPGQNRYSFHFIGKSPDGVDRSGRIDADLYGDLPVPGTHVRFTFQNYFEDAMMVNAGDSLVNTGISGTNLTFTNTVTGGVIQKDSIGAIRFGASLVYEVPAEPGIGFSSMLISVGGTIGGTSSKGFTFSSVISEPLIYPVYSETCAWVRQGSFLLYLSDTASVAGTISFPGISSCNDSVYYDFGVTTYRWRMQMNYLNH